MLKRVFGCLVIVFFAAGILFNQETKQPASVKIEIPVRVFDGSRFVDDLSLDNFELYENGVKQNISALYLTEKTKVIRRDIKKQVQPTLNRQFCFLFQMTEYNPRINEGMAYFFNNIFRSGDSVILLTPVKQYSLSPKAMEIKSKEDLVKDIIQVVRKDTQMGSSEYNSALVDLRRIVSSISASTGGQQTMYQTSIDTTTDSNVSPLEQLIPNYRETLEKLETMRIVDEKSFMAFASHLKSLPGQKIVFLFYQREFRPELDSTTMNRLVSNNQDNPALLGQLQDLFQVYYRDVDINIDRMKQVFADSSVMLNLLFFNKTPQNIPGVYMREQSEDLYQIFTELSQSTGGIVNSSQNPDAALKNASDIADQCYLLYYTPTHFIADNQFKNIEVKIKDQNYRVLHREGYFQYKSK
ncbi:MAG: VWA domain-containing protein [Candidatus Aminicenantes bacterium]|nr:VWA domain-containing protein [Candidatus Aminicenantes bacterium]